ncbi:MAG: hypothetical protein JO215_08830, partial [Ktedonobacteraceae bacterium]|nr:hypothetical protein [Ktedonobacteraceae bacterium]
MRERKYRQIGVALLLPIIALPLLVMPARAAQHSGFSATRNLGTTPINATVYLTTDALQPIFQARINQQVPGTVNNAISAIINNMPANDRGWAGQMATTLIQPSATLSG